MTRLKFLVFALLAVGLWVAHLFLLSPAVGAAAVAQATGQAVAAPAAVALRLESSRSELQAAVLGLAQTPAVTNPGPKGPFTPDRFNQVRAAVAAALPEPQRAAVVVGIANEAGVLLAQGSLEPAAAPEGFDARAAGLAGARGEVLDAFGSKHLFYSVPILGVDRGEVHSVGTAFVGAPLAADAQKLVDAVASELSLSAVGLSVGGKVVASAGPRKALAATVGTLGQPGQTHKAEIGAALALGPLKLPLLTAGDVMGGGTTLEVGVRRDVPGTPFEVIAVASVRPAMEALAGYQKTALFLMLGLLVAVIAFTLLLGGAAAEEEEEYVAPRVPVVSATSARAEAPPALPLTQAPTPAEAHPEDFDFGQATPGALPPPAPEHAAPQARDQAPPPPKPDAPWHQPPPADDYADDPFASLGPPVGEAPEPVMAAPGLPVRAGPPVHGFGDEDEDYESQRTMAYPAHHAGNPMSMASTQSNPAVDPFALAGGMMSADEQMQSDNPDATRVATIPQELLNASARNTRENPIGAVAQVGAPMPRVATAIAPPAIATAGGGSEDAHFQDVFRDFVATRERCGEVADGLTFDKFAAKLRKNKDQLVAKYSCRTVRFQVYVKEGKAALKATPVKD